MNTRGRSTWWKPRNTMAKVLAVFFVLVVTQVLWAVTQERFEWLSLVVVALVGMLYLLVQGLGGDRLSWSKKLRATLFATWVTVALGIGFAVYMTLRAANEPGTEERAVVGFAILFGGFALLGVAMAVPYTLTLLRLIREDEPPRG